MALLPLLFVSIHGFDTLDPKGLSLTYSMFITQEASQIGTLRKHLGPFKSGDNVTFEVNYKNNTNRALTKSAVTYPLPKGMRGVFGSSQCKGVLCAFYIDKSENMIWHLHGEIPAKASGILSYRLKII